MGNSDVNPPVGIQPDDLEAEFYARGGNVCAGYCYPLAMEQSSVISGDGVTVSVQPGGEGSVFANIVGGDGALASDAFGGIFVIAMEDIADQQKGRCKVRGLVNAVVSNAANAAIVIGNPMHVQAKLVPVPNAASSLNAQIANANNSPRKYVAQAMAAYSGTPSTQTTMLVSFDGWHGFGAGQV